MATTLENTLIRFNDGTTQSTAATTPPAASTTVAGIVQLSTSTASTSTTLAATPSAVKAAYDLAASKADASHGHPYLGYDIGHNVVGSLCFAYNAKATIVNPGGTLAGSNLSPAGIASAEVNNSSVPAQIVATGGLSGTWRALGYGYVNITSSRNSATLWQRIS